MVMLNHEKFLYLNSASRTKLCKNPLFHKKSNTKNAFYFLEFRLIDVSQVYTTPAFPILMLCIIANVQNICSLMIQEEYNINRIVLSTLILHSLTRNSKTNIQMRGVKKKKKFISSKQINDWLLINSYFDT